MAANEGEYATVPCSFVVTPPKKSPTAYGLRWTKKVDNEAGYVTVYHFSGPDWKIDAGLDIGYSRYLRTQQNLRIPDFREEDAGTLCCEIFTFSHKELNGTNCTDVHFIDFEYDKVWDIELMDDNHNKLVHRHGYQVPMPNNATMATVYVNVSYNEIFPACDLVLYNMIKIDATSVMHAEPVATRDRGEAEHVSNHTRWSLGLTAVLNVTCTGTYQTKLLATVENCGFDVHSPKHDTQKWIYVYCGKDHESAPIRSENSADEDDVSETPPRKFGPKLDKAVADEEDQEFCSSICLIIIVSICFGMALNIILVVIIIVLRNNPRSDNWTDSFLHPYVLFNYLQILMCLIVPYVGFFVSLSIGMNFRSRVDEGMGSGPGSPYRLDSKIDWNGEHYLEGGVVIVDRAPPGFLPRKKSSVTPRPVRQLHTRDEYMKAKNSGPSLVVIDFFATWCGPCKSIAPKLDELSAHMPEVNFFKIDVDLLEDVCAEEGVTSMPTFKMFKRGREVGRVTGADILAVKKLIFENR